MITWGVEYWLKVPDKENRENGRGVSRSDGTEVDNEGSHIGGGGGGWESRLGLGTRRGAQ